VSFLDNHFEALSEISRGFVVYDLDCVRLCNASVCVKVGKHCFREIASLTVENRIDIESESASIIFLETCLQAASCHSHRLRSLAFRIWPTLACVECYIWLDAYDYLHRESKKTRHQTLAHNFTKYWPIFKILSLLDSVGNL